MQNRILLSLVSPRLRGASQRYIVFLAALMLAAGLGVLNGCGDAASDAPFETVFNPCQRLLIAAQPGVRPAELESLDDAIKMWNRAANLQLIRVKAGDEPDETPHIPVRFEDAAPFMHGHYSDKQGVVTVNHRLSPREHTITLAHELGHAFGLHHVSKSTRLSVMNHANLRVEVTPQDVETLHALWPACSPQREPKTKTNSAQLVDK